MLAVSCTHRRGDFLLEVDLELPSPGVTALFGRSGAGKSTLVAVLAGLLTPERGRITLNGDLLFDSASATNIAAERRGVGYVFQDGRLFPHYDVRGNLNYGLRRAGVRPARINFDNVVELLGLASLLDRRVFGLSGGERQRVALGRALLAQPRLLLLDEPFASLDVARKEELLPYFERLRDELALPIVYVTHAFDEVIRLAQHVIVLENGRAVVAADLGTACRSPALHAITGSEITGSVLDGTVTRRDPAEALALVRCTDLDIRVALTSAEPGAQVRLFIAADDVAVARERPQAISMRNILRAQVTGIETSEGSALLHLAVGSERLMARVTHSAIHELELAPGTGCFALFKAVATQGRRFARRTEAA